MRETFIWSELIWFDSKLDQTHVSCGKRTNGRKSNLEYLKFEKVLKVPKSGITETSACVRRAGLVLSQIALKNVILSF